jgi:hypothetical protein
MASSRKVENPFRTVPVLPYFWNDMISAVKNNYIVIQKGVRYLKQWGTS